LKGTIPAVELLVIEDRKVQLTLVGEDGKALTPSTEVVTLTTGDRGAPTTLTFTSAGNTLVSNTALPEGDDLAVVVELKKTPDAVSRYSRLKLNL